MGRYDTSKQEEESVAQRAGASSRPHAPMASTRPKALVIGHGAMTLSALKSLAPVLKITALLRDGDDPYGNAPIQLAESLGTPVVRARSPRQLSEHVKRFAPDIVVAAGCPPALELERLAFAPVINVHESFLPLYRGMSPVTWALIKGEGFTGVTIHHVGPALDDGPILYQERVAIEPRDTAISLCQRLGAIVERELGEAALRACAGDAGVEQRHEAATYCCERVPEDGDINWADSAWDIDRLVRGLASPHSGAFTYQRGERLIIRRAEPVPDPGFYVVRRAGRVVDLCEGRGWVDVLTGDGMLRLLEIQPLGGGPCLPASVIRSRSSTLGTSKEGLLARIEMLEARLRSLESACTDRRDFDR